MAGAFVRDTTAMAKTSVRGFFDGQGVYPICFAMVEALTMVASVEDTSTIFEAYPFEAIVIVGHLS